MRYTLLIAPLIMVLSHPALAQTMDYDTCIAQAQANPVQGLTSAQNWRDTGGGGQAARHCRSIALAALGSFAEAAQVTESLAVETPDLPAKADLLTQAGDFQLAASNPTAARALYDRALAAEPSSIEALDGRARAAAANKDFATAITDLNRLLWLLPNDAEALSLRAAARRQTGDTAGALTDSEAAIAADPQSAVAYFERGAARAITGDRNGARADWQQAEALDPGGDIARLAALNRAKLPL